MATQASYFIEDDADAGTGQASRQPERDTVSDPYRLRALPNEDVYFYRKPIDNYRLVRQADPQVRRKCWKYIAQAAVITLVFTGLFWPNVYGLMTGYQLERLRQERQRLLNDSRALEIEEARLLDPQRLEHLARVREYIDPEPQQVVHLYSKGDKSLALNVSSK